MIEASLKTFSQWKKIGTKPHHGICIPLFSLRSKTSCGIGEFLDLLPLIAWCKECGFDCLQLLPLHDTGLDPSPYNPLSCLALDPIYLSLRHLPNAKDLAQPLDAFRLLNEQPQLMRSEVRQLKFNWLRHYFTKTFDSLKKTSDYQEFIQDNPWLSQYAQFKALQEAFGMHHWNTWPIPLGSQLPPSCTQETLFHCFLQYHCFAQMKKVRAFASKQSVFLQGDMPILPASNSVDTWTFTSCFYTTQAIGAPPDLYNPLGQLWGFPPFNWEEMRKSKFLWWKLRLQTMQKLYHMYRIDHTVGLFRLWVVPYKDKPMEGFFIPEDPDLWESQGKSILNMFLNTSSMLPIAEDLGTIPPIVYSTLKELGICGTKVVRWQKDVQGNFISPEEYEPFSVTTMSTADLAPVPLWWKECPSEAVEFARFKNWVYNPILTREQQMELLWDAHHTKSFFHINPLQEYLFLFPELAKSNLSEERINIPGTLSSTNWIYRLKPYLEDLCANKSLFNAIKNILK